METIACDICSWVDGSPPDQREFRQAIHIILLSISKDIDLQNTMVMKGGLLMAIRYKSSRFTTDLDFSSSLRRADIHIQTFIEKLNQKLAITSANSEYGLDCRIQSYRINPKSEAASFSNIELSIGYSYKGTPKHAHLLKNQCPTKIDVDFNLNESILQIEKLDIGEGAKVQAYTLTDLVAEKFRSLLQQEVRNRYRRQDTYDLRFLIEAGIKQEDHELILTSLIEKARSRGIDARPDSLDNDELRRRAERDYHTLADEVTGGLPDFDESYNLVKTFYRSLPWNTHQNPVSS